MFLVRALGYTFEAAYMTNASLSFVDADGLPPVVRGAAAIATLSAPPMLQEPSIDRLRADEPMTRAEAASLLWGYVQGLERGMALVPQGRRVFRDLSVRENLEALDSLARRTAAACPVVVGFVDRTEAGLHNAAALLRNGTVEARYHKMQLPNFGVFDERRYFEPGDTAALIELCGVRIGLTICEDIWEPGPPASDEALAGAELHRGDLVVGFGGGVGLEGIPSLIETVDVVERYGYDDLNRLQTWTVIGPSDSPTYTYHFDDHGNLTGRTTPSGQHQWSFEYTSARPHAITRSTVGSVVKNYDYDERGRRVEDGEPALYEALAKVMRAADEPDRMPEAIAAFKRSPQFTKLSPGVRINQGQIFDIVAADFAEFRVHEVEAPDMRNSLCLPAATSARSFSSRYSVCGAPVVILSVSDLSASPI